MKFIRRNSLTSLAATGFGQYPAKTRQWDQVAYNAPYYLIVEAAGNDRSDNPSAGEQFFYLDWPAGIIARPGKG